MPSSQLTYRYRLKDSQHRNHLIRLSWAVHTVWNFCNEVQILAWRRERRVLTADDLIKRTAGASKELGLHSDTIAEVCREYASRCKPFRKRRLKWRSRKQSLGWIPFQARFLRVAGDAITYLGRTFRCWLSPPIEGDLKTGSFTQEARGRGYVNFQCEVEDTGTPHGDAEIGIDLGLKDQATCSDGRKYNRESLTHRYADDLAKVHPGPLNVGYMTTTGRQARARRSIGPRSCRLFELFPGGDSQRLGQTPRVVEGGIGPRERVEGGPRCGHWHPL